MEIYYTPQKMSHLVNLNLQHMILVSMQHVYGPPSASQGAVTNVDLDQKVGIAAKDWETIGRKEKLKSMAFMPFVFAFYDFFINCVNNVVHLNLLVWNDNTIELVK